MAGPILIVDDDARLRRIIQRILEKAGYVTIVASSGEEALEILEDRGVGLLITDISMPPGMTGLELLDRVQGTEDPPPTIVISGEPTIDRAVHAVKSGAVDFLTKPMEPERLEITVQNALKVSRLETYHEELRRAFSPGAELVGQSQGMQRVRDLVERVAPTDARVLILGENGTGKELVATALYEGSERSEAPFVTLNCAAVPENLVESELFGHEKGAFTGALKSHKGRFERADGGTLFLDEIGDMPGPMQAKLLRVLQEGTLERVGGSRTIEVDARVIAATNRDVEELVADGTFREDLLYRLNVVTIEVPPLRERTDDIPPLVEHFLSSSTRGRKLTISDEAMAALCRYSFPGNVRELSNIVERLGILARSEEVGVDTIQMLLPTRRGTSAPAGRLYRPGESLRDLMSEVEKRIMAEAIEAHDDSKPEAAEALSVERSHFYKKCRQHDL